MGMYRTRQAQVPAIHWTGDNLDDVRSFLGYEVPEKDGVLTLPGGHAKIGDWVLIGEYRNIYAVPDEAFCANHYRAKSTPKT